MLLVGLDCATQPRNTGLARATLEGGRVTVRDAEIGRTAEGVADTLAGWLRESPRAVLALDAPLGWPAPMARALAEHRAGGPLAPAPNDMFNRATDLAVWRVLGKKPMEVGANWLARTAHAALATLAAVRERVDVEMGWAPGAVPGAASGGAAHALEVYPAATLLARGLPTRGYKAAGARDLRRGLADALDVDWAPDARASAIATDHALDAAICCLAAADYARGDVLTPEAAGVPVETARREGWIWFRPPGP